MVDQHGNQQQQRTAAVMGDRNGQWQIEQHVTDAQRDLQGQGGDKHRGQTRQAVTPELPGQRQQYQRHRERAEPMRQVDGGSGLAIKHPAEVIRADVVMSQVERIGEIHLRPPLAMAGWEIGTGHRRVVTADPAAQRHLDDHREHADQREGFEPARHARHRRPPAGQAQRQQEQEAQSGEATQQMRRDHLRPKLQGDGPHAECRLSDDHREQQQGKLERLSRLGAAA